MGTTSKPSKIKRLSAVVRVSRRKGRKGSAFMSPALQRKTIKQWAKANSIEIVSWWDETDSVSGKTTDRVGLKAALDEAHSGKTDGVIVAKADRFARNLIEGLTAVRDLQTAGKAFVAVNDGILGDEASSDADGKRKLQLVMMFAEWQLDSLTEGWDAAVASHIARGVARNAPYGYRKLKNKRRLVIDEDQAKWVRLMFERRAKGTSWHAIADELTEAGVAPPRGGHRWNYTVVTKMVHNRTYLGELRSGEHVNVAACEPIVSLDLWQQVERIRDTTPVKRGRASFPLGGLVRCAGCGSRMTGSTKKCKATSITPAHDDRYYKCRRRYGWGVCTDPASVNAVELERHLFESFQHDFIDTENFVGKTSTADLEEANEALRQAEAELDYWSTSPAVAEQRRALGNDWFEKGTTARTNVVLDAREEITRIQAETMGVELPDGFGAMWTSERMTDELRRHYYSLAYSVIAVRSSRDRRRPVAERCRLWITNEPGAPDDLPGRGGTHALRPITFDEP